MEKINRIDIDNSMLSMPFIKVNIHYLEHVTSRCNVQSDFHAHNDWQAEFIIEGNIKCNFKDQQIEINSSKIIIIPPGIFHSFTYGSDYNEYYSVKFTCDIENVNIPLLFDNKENVIPIKKYFLEILKTNDDQQLIAIHMQNILKILLELNLIKQKSLKEKSVSEKIADLLQKTPGNYCSANEIAEQMRYSRTYLSKKIKEETGMSLKPFIDRQRINTAKGLLQLSDLSISEIAFQLQFVDVFTFSRCFKRIIFMTPSQFRNIYQKKNDLKQN
jgi:AraC-like DNA-binding protein